MEKLVHQSASDCCSHKPGATVFWPGIHAVTWYGRSNQSQGRIKRVGGWSHHSKQKKHFMLEYMQVYTCKWTHFKQWTYSNQDMLKHHFHLNGRTPPQHIFQVVRWSQVSESMGFKSRLKFQGPNRGLIRNCVAVAHNLEPPSPTPPTPAWAVSKWTWIALDWRSVFGSLWRWEVFSLGQVRQP